MLEFFIYQTWAIHALIYTKSLDASFPVDNSFVLKLSIIVKHETMSPSTDPP